MKFPNAPHTALPRFLTAAVVMLFFAAIAVLVTFPLCEDDTFWHLANGRAMVQSGHIVEQEIFSFTAPGVPFHNHEWLSQIVFYLVFARWGASGLVTFSALLTVILAWVLFRTIRNLGTAPIPAALLCFLAILAGVGRYSVRPQLFSFLGIALLGYLLHGYKTGRQEKGVLIGLPAIMICWDFLHGAVYGLLLLGAFVTGETLKYLLRDRLAQWPGMVPMSFRRLQLLWIATGVTLCLMLFSPFGPRSYDVFLNLVNSSTDASSFVAEYLPTPWQGFALFWSFLALAILLLFSAGKRLDLTHLLILILFACLAIRYNRVTAPFCLVALPIIATYLNPLSEKVQRRKPLFAKLLLAAAAAGSLAYVGNIKFADPESLIPFSSRISEASLPVGPVRFIEAAGLNGNMYNTDAYGGYLAFFLAPERKIFHYNHPSVFRNYLGYLNDPRMPEKMNINYAIIGREQELKLFPFDEWAPVYWAPTATVVVKRNEQNQDLISRFGIRYFHPLLPESRFRELASRQWIYPVLMEEMAHYLEFQHDRRIADMLGELLKRPAGALTDEEIVALVTRAGTWNRDSATLQAALRQHTVEGPVSERATKIPGAH